MTEVFKTNPLYKAPKALGDSELSRGRVQISFPEDEGRTDQSYKASSDINNIMKDYAKTGMLPQVRDQIAEFMDTTLIPDLQTAFEITKRASEAFLGLDPRLRTLMNNDPANLEYFIRNPANTEILYDYGVLVKEAPNLPDPMTDLNKNVSELVKELKSNKKQ